MVDTKGFIVDITPTTRKVIFFRRLKIIFLGRAMVRLYRRRLSHPPAKILWTKKNCRHPSPVLLPTSSRSRARVLGGGVGHHPRPLLPADREEEPPPPSRPPSVGSRSGGAGAAPVLRHHPCRGRPRASQPPPSPSLPLAGSRRGGEPSPPLVGGRGEEER